MIQLSVGVLIGVVIVIIGSRARACVILAGCWCFRLIGCGLLVKIRCGAHIQVIAFMVFRIIIHFTLSLEVLCCWGYSF